MLKINWKSKKFLGIMAAGVILATATGLTYLLKAETVDLATVETGPIEEIVSDTGTLRSRSMVEMTAYGSGTVEAIEVEVGQYVKAGTTLLAIDDTLLLLQLESLSNEVNALKVNLDYLSSDIGELTVESASDSARIARENYDKAKKDYENAKLLFEAGAISQSELDSFELLYNVNQMSYTIAANSADATSGSQNSNLDQLTYQLQSLQAQLERVKLEIERYTLKAPFDGVVSALYVDEQDFAMAGSPLLQIYEEDYYIEVNLIEDDLLLIGKDTPVRLDLDGEKVDVGIIRVHPTIQKTLSDLGVTQLKGTVDVTAAEGLSMVGREFDVDFIVDAADETLLLDRDALIRYDGQTHVYKVVDGRAERVSVTIGIRGETAYEVLDGLVAGDQVILNPGENIEDGVKVKN